MKSPIIENRRGVSRFQRYSQGLLTGIFWVILILLLRPLLTLGAWLVGGHLFSRAFLQAEGIELLRVPLTYVVVVVLMGITLIGWASYNLLRFRHNERRIHQPDPVKPLELAEFFGVSEMRVQHWQRSRRIIMHHDELGRLEVDGADSDRILHHIHVDRQETKPLT